MTTFTGFWMLRKGLVTAEIWRDDRSEMYERHEHLAHYSGSVRSDFRRYGWVTAETPYDVDIEWFKAAGTTYAVSGDPDLQVGKVVVTRSAREKYCDCPEFKGDQQLGS